MTNTANSLTLEILSYLGKCDYPVTAPALAEALGASRATMYRTLDDLSRLGWVLAEGRPQAFRPSARVLALGFRCVQYNSVRERALPFAIELAMKVGGMWGIAFYERGDAIFTDRVEVVGDLVVPRLTTERYPAPTTASGKILLAHQSSDEIERVASRPLRAYAANTKRSREEILEEIALTRRRGYGFAERELREDTTGISMPVFGSSGEVVCTLGLSLYLPAREGHLEEAVVAARAAAARASTALGYRGSATSASA